MVVSSSFREAGCLDPILCLIVVHGLFPLSQERIHALVGTQEPVHTHNGFERQDAKTQERKYYAFVFKHITQEYSENIYPESSQVYVHLCIT